ncbi:hypothetical protein GCM10027515_04970 [Schumannella luteola]|uniref:Uncharacterized protein n=1 Tax=Schumannella luteola TaxID=472059 RepID=A0A852Y5Z8_9MICO|nr:hypothetical protein [Schumannella luteola]NYG98366.1 hypothetical protein [Schumannella luteola]TPX05785.1 hypothetical protein FJ656_05010 [Schumannella luteola]
MLDDIRPPRRVLTFVVPIVVFIVGLWIAWQTGLVWLIAPLQALLVAAFFWREVSARAYLERRDREKRDLSWRGIADDSSTGVARRMAQARAHETARRHAEAALREPGAATRARFLRPRGSTPFRSFAHEDAAAAQRGVPGSGVLGSGAPDAGGLGFGGRDADHLADGDSAAPEIFDMPAPTTPRLAAAPPDPELYDAEAAARRRARRPRAPRPVSSRDLGARFRYPISFDAEGRATRDPDPDPPAACPAPDRG